MKHIVNNKVSSDCQCCSIINNFNVNNSSIVCYQESKPLPLLYFIHAIAITKTAFLTRNTGLTEPKEFHLQD